jgi:phosphonate degradation associated HDIG domain protein
MRSAMAQMTSSLQDILDLLTVQGHQQYGDEAVSQLEHALQCAALAEATSASREMIAACLLHDLGHLLQPGGSEEGDHGDHIVLWKGDRHHEYAVLPALKPLFPAAVTEPIRLHVQAKRYLCAIDPAYHHDLSPESQRSLKHQGGILSTEEAQQFINQPFAEEAVQLRIWDDRAKIPGLVTPGLQHFMGILAAVVNPT